MGQAATSSGTSRRPEVDLLSVDHSTANRVSSPAVRMQDGSYVLHNANVTRGGVAIGVVNGKINRATESTQARADLFLTSVTVAGTVSTTHVSIPLTFNQISVSGSGP